MRLLLDESSDVRVAPYLRAWGHDVRIVARDYQSAISDEEVLAIAFRERRILITNDKDFGDLVFVKRRPHHGVVLLRLGTLELVPTLDRLEHVLQDYADQLDRFLVVTPHRVRIRRR
jgi:predicted nuclease of predicted toxin-antitoxin system